MKPPKLKNGDTIGMIAPADPVFGVCPDLMKNTGYDYLRGKGFVIKEGSSMYESSDYTSGSIEMRVKDIHDFFLDDSIKCIMVFWGGLNSNQLLDQLNYDLIAKHPKIFIGYSDTTALTCAITKKTGLLTFSGPGGISFAKNKLFDYTWESFKKTCVDGEDGLKIEESESYSDDSDNRMSRKNTGIKVFQSGTCKGQVVVGNMSTLLALSGTEYFPDFKDKVLFLEEDETCNVSMIDRYMTQFSQMGIFDSIVGLVVGRFTTQSGFINDVLFTNILKRVVKKNTIPVLYNLDFGHSDPLATIPHGGTCLIKDREVSFERAVIL